MNKTLQNTIDKKQEFKLIIPDKLTKDNFNEVANVLFDYIDENANPLEAIIKLKAYMEVLGLLKNKLMDSAINEAEKYSKNERALIGVKFDVTAGKTDYDYSEDAIWAGLKKQLKERQELLKGLKKPMADIETGEIIKPAIPTHSGEVIKITFKK